MFSFIFMETVTLLNFGSWITDILRYKCKRSESIIDRAQKENIKLIIKGDVQKKQRNRLCRKPIFCFIGSFKQNKKYIIREL